MATSDELRAKLTEALIAHRGESFSWYGVRCECAQDTRFVLMGWDEHRRHVMDALMPVIAEALARAWDEGSSTALDHAIRNDDGITLRLDKPNPWRSGRG